jgi:hypothetical protein
LNAKFGDFSYGWQVLSATDWRKKYIVLLSGGDAIFRSMTLVALSWLGVLNAVLSVFGFVIVRNMFLSGTGRWQLFLLSEFNSYVALKTKITKKSERRLLRTEIERLSQLREMRVISFDEWWERGRKLNDRLKDIDD